MGTAHVAKAVVACPDPAVVRQPDGTSLTVNLHGDEWFNYVTTADGYTIVKDDADGFYKYAVLDGAVLRAGTVVAHDVAMRSAAETSLLRATVRHLTPDARTIAAKRAKHRLHGMTGHYDYKNFRGLVILVQFNDCQFVYDDAHTLFNDMINKHDYEGFMSNAMFPELIPYTGSVRDYFYASSAGEFDPVFDVVGPVTIDYSQYDGRNNAASLVTAALDAADALVNYKDYDRDRNGTVDMVYFVFAGGGSNFSGNDSRLLWPHASSIMSKSLDGVSFGRYACSTELFSRPESKTIDGIGTICHEFSHVLGVADLYDTDGTTGGTCVTPGKWSLMAQGSYLNQSRTPCLYSTYERYAAGFITPETLTRKGNYTVPPISSHNKGYRIDSNVADEYFLLETRKKEGFDAYLPGEGLLVWRVDSTNATAWENNRANATAAHPLYQLLRAASGTTDSASDPFPGSQGITAINNETTPSLCSWTGRKSDYSLSSIARNATDGSVSFHLDVQRFQDFVEDFEDMAVSTTTTRTVEGKFTTWTLKTGKAASKIVATSGEGTGNGTRSCAMLRGSELATGALPWESSAFSFTFFNPTTSSTVVRTHICKPGSTLWTIVADDNGMESVSVAAGENAKISFTKVFEQGTQVRITEYTGSTSVNCYVDDVTFTVAQDEPAIVGDIDGNGSVDVSDVTYLVNVVLGNAAITDACDVDGNGNVDVSDVTMLINMILK